VFLRLSKNSVSITTVLGDITEFAGDAVVNPANKYLVMGGGVAAAIKGKGGEEIEREARMYAPLEIGEAVVTSAGRLKCRAVIHAPTVESPGGRSTRDYVYRATIAALRVARERGFKSVAFPLMGAGVGGLSPEESIDAMSRAFLEAGEGLEIHVYVTRREVLERIASHLKQSGWREV
jgi:O-acetyl-ADP-ribose deacetylase (regulator of RNase III)